MMDKKQKNKILALFSALSLLMGVVCNMTIPVFASNASIPSADTYRVSFTSDQLTFRTERTAYTIADADESNLIKIPLYFWYSSSAADNTYMSGWVIMAQTRFMNFTFNTGSVTPSYFEAYDGGSYYCSSPASDYRFTVYFDNHIAANNTPHLLGYYVFDVSAYTAIQIDVTSGTTNVGIASSGVFGSTGEYGLVQSIINGLDNSEDIDTIIGALQNIDTVDLESIISGISSNTSLLTQIYQRLGQMQSQNQTFYNNIDSILDTVSWSNYTGTCSFYDSSLNSVTSGSYRDFYIKFQQNFPQNSALYYITIPVVYGATIYSTYANIEFKFGVFGSGSTFYEASRCFVMPIDVNNENPSYIRLLVNPFGISSRYANGYGFHIIADRLLNISSGNVSVQFINSNDIEYYDIYDTMILYNLYRIVESYINANVSAPVEQAATSAAGLANNQAAAEQSLAALSPADMGDFDSAVSDITILDDVSNSLVFWTNAVHAFSTRSGSLWGVFIFGLLIGLIAFILRLRR